VAETLEELLAGCGQGDEQAVCELVRRFAESCRRLAAALLGDEHLAEDAVQEAFLTALTRLGQLRRTECFPGWLRQIVRAEVGRILRRRREQPNGLAIERPAADPPPDEQAQFQEQRELVRAALKRLPPAQQSVAEMFYLKELGYSSIADRLNLPRGTVKRRLHDARRRLRDILLGGAQGAKERKPAAPPEWPLPL